jgi:hypothetical protein
MMCPATPSDPERSTQIVYESLDLELFAQATNWKRYWAERLRPFIAGKVIEVGAGLGVSTEFAYNDECTDWLCLEPDPANASRLARRIANGELPKTCRARAGVLSDLDRSVLAETILYVDVLEHIEDDETEMRVAAAHLALHGHLVVLSPAWNYLYTAFDKAVGHHRRYRKADVKRLGVPGLASRSVFFLDSIGLLASLANRVLLKSPMPSPEQIAFWDRVLVPLSSHADPLFRGRVGKTIVMVWQKTRAEPAAHSSTDPQSQATRSLS